MLRVLRIVAGLIGASFVAGVVLVIHVAQLSGLAAAASEELPQRLAALGQLTALYTTQIAMFLVPLGLLLAAVAELNRWRSWAVYVGFGLLLAAAGYFLQYQSEGELRTIVNPFAAQVFALQGLAGGLAYWLLAGRYAGWRRGGGPQRAEPYPVGRPRLQVAEATEPTAQPKSIATSAVPGSAVAPPSQSVPIKSQAVKPDAGKAAPAKPDAAVKPTGAVKPSGALSAPVPAAPKPTVPPVAPVADKLRDQAVVVAKPATSVPTTVAAAKPVPAQPRKPAGT
ncbi:MAG: hypothetical protein K2Y05_11585 [Hyphomicrobiaceae bacterium]|nr:hypothetical protein [Hyphomicrobiaceae bacterium]